MNAINFNEGDALAYLLDGKGGASALNTLDVAEWTADQGEIWVHLNYANAEAMAWIEQRFNLNPLVLEALMAKETRPRTEVVGDGLLITLRGVNLNPGADPEDMVSIRLWVDDTRIISSSRRQLVSLHDLVERLRAGRGPIDSGDFIVDLIDGLVWSMSGIVDQMEDAVAALEEQIMISESSQLRFDLATLRRQAIAVRRYLAPQREALTRLISEKVVWLNDSSRLYLREVNDRLIRHIEDIDAVRERAAITQEELNSRHSEQLNNKMYMLSIVAAIFLPLGFLTGLLGINVAGIPGADNPNAFWLFITFLSVLVIGQALFFRWKKWM